MRTPTPPPVDVSQLNSEAKRVFDVYRRSREIYDRTTAAMGRAPRYRVTMSNTTTVRIGDDKLRSS